MFIGVDTPSASTRAAPPARRLALVATLGGLCGLAPLGIDMYVPGLPALATSLATTEAAAQLSVTAFLLGIVVGQLVFGPLSDRIGRRSLLLAGPAASALFSLGCAIAPTVEVFVAARFLAAFCGAAGMVLARAVITDLFRGPALGRYLAMLGIVLGVAPIVAPALGGVVLQVASWRAIFVVLAVVGVALAGCVWRWVPESLPPRRRNAEGIGATFRVMGGMLRDRRLVGHLLTLGLVSAALFTYVTDSSFVFQQHYGISASLYSLVFATNAVGMMLAGTVSAALAGRVAPRTMLSAGLGIALAATLAHAVLLPLIGSNLAISWICLALAMTGIGTVIPATMTIGQTIGAGAPGATSALLGTAQFLVGAVVSPLAGLLAPSDPMIMAVIMAAAAAGAVITSVALTRE